MSLKSGNRSLRFVFIILTVIIFCYAFFFHDLVETIEHSPLVNSSIITVQIVGILYSFYVAFLLVIGIKDWRRFTQREQSDSSPIRLRGAVGLLQKRTTELVHENGDVRNSLLHSLHESLTHKVAGAEYLSGLLVGLGLLGTFIGLIMTMGSIKSAIGVMSSGNADISALLDGLAAPLGGMSAAFTSSLLGLLGSLVMGLISHMLSRASDNLYFDIYAWVHTQLAESNPDIKEYTSELAKDQSGIIDGGASYCFGKNYQIERLLKGLIKFSQTPQVQQHEIVSYLNKLLVSLEEMSTLQVKMAEFQQKSLDNLEKKHYHMMGVIELQNSQVVKILQDSLYQQSILVTALKNNHDCLSTNTDLLQQSLINHENQLLSLGCVNSELSELNRRAVQENLNQEQLIAIAQDNEKMHNRMLHVLIECTGYLNQNSVQIGDTFEQVAQSMKGLQVEMQGCRQQLLTLESILRMGSGETDSIVQVVKSQNNTLLECVRQMTEARVSMLSNRSS